MASVYSRLTGWQSPDFFIILPPGTVSADLKTNFTKIMATKKTTPKTTKTAAEKPAPAAKKAAKKAAKTTAKSGEKSEEPKPAAKKAAAVKKPASPKPAAKITPDVLARAAYLNYRRRVEQGLPGDSHGDWLEAERSLGKMSDS